MGISALRMPKPSAPLRPGGDALCPPGLESRPGTDALRHDTPSPALLAGLSTPPVHCLHSLISQLRKESFSGIDQARRGIPRVWEEGNPAGNPLPRRGLPRGRRDPTPRSLPGLELWELAFPVTLTQCV